MLERNGFDLTGVVQGVGLRPHVHALATSLGLAGFVQNLGARVRIEVEGPAEAVEEFSVRLSRSSPVLARIESSARVALSPAGARGFKILESAPGGSEPVFVAPDVAPCAECLAELFDPKSRRHRYPFSCCSHCGPRLTVVKALPYDRVNTTLSGFPMCAACRAEYEDPSDRRFHAEPTACPECGPRLEVPIGRAVEVLAGGGIVAIKGAGGFHLACDATDAVAVERLRARKHRDAKPFAVMVASVDAARALCVVSEAGARALQDPARPIVLLPSLGRLPDCVAPGLRELGLMLPSTLLHALLLHDLPDRPLVMTSGNASDEPIAFDDADARRRLGEIADLFLGHDRPIHLRCDDSLVRGPAVLRRARGHAPQSLPLPAELEVPTLAVGGMLKGTFALGVGRTAWLSHHLGDLQHASAFDAFTASVEHYQRLFGVRPARLVTDLHPDYPTTAWARGQGLPVLQVQHHHAHVASCLAEHGVRERVAAVAFDGSGLGTDGTSWGGEFFAGTLGALERVGHLAPVPLVGGDRAAREPWRMALAWLRACGLPTNRVATVAGAERVTAAEQLMTRPAHAPLTSSVGRLFDAAAWLLGTGENATFEGQPAMRLEALAWTVPHSGDIPIEGFDPAPLIRSLADERVPRAIRARRFHDSLARWVAERCEPLGCTKVVLTGGVFQNALLLEQAARQLRARGMEPLLHQAVPPNDGGLAFGQLAIAAAFDERAR